MKKLFLAAAIVGMTTLTAFAGNGGGCKGKGCTCTGNCKDDKCTMSCCTSGKKACKDTKCMKDGKCTDKSKSSSSSATGTTGK